MLSGNLGVGAFLFPPPLVIRQGFFCKCSEPVKLASNTWTNCLLRNESVVVDSDVKRISGTVKSTKVPDVQVSEH